MDRAVSCERRTAPRVRFSGGVLPPAARIHPGRDVIVVDLSRQGALVEGIWRLRPGSRVDLQLELNAQEAIVRGRVERCFVASLGHPSGVRYRAAIRFDGAVAFVPPGDLLQGYSVPSGTRDVRTDPGQRLPGKHVRPGSTLKYASKPQTKHT
jgi:hypothetical protein